jgi:hypothetical protein
MKYSAMNLQVKRFELVEMKKVYFSLLGILLAVSLLAQNTKNVTAIVSETSVADTNRNIEFDSIMETDPVFDASVASGISVADTTSWNNKLDSFTETDPVFNTSVASGINTNDTINWNNKQDILKAGTGLEIIGNTISNKIDFYLGQDTLGGIVFYIYIGSDGKQHGLIVSKIEDYSIKWQDTSTTTNGTRSWDGEYNTNLMTDSPAKDWVINNFSSDWYLPSIDELSFLWHNRFHVNKALHKLKKPLLSNSDGYWSSTEFNEKRAFTMGIEYGIGHIGKTNNYYVRAVRAF